VEKVANFILWPGTKVCEHLGIDPKGDLGLLRSFINMLIMMPIGLFIVWVLS
jgi:hypothetical protein